MNRKNNKNMNKKNNKNHLVKNSIQDSIDIKNVRMISFDMLDKISHINYERFNRNVWTENVLIDFPKLKGSKVMLVKVLDHYHYLGEPTVHHYRCLVYIDKYPGLLYQDVSIEQWNSFKTIRK